MQYESFGEGGVLSSPPHLPTAEAPPLLSRYPREELLRMYRLMLLIREFEEKAAEMYTRAKIGGYLHLNVGEEAAVVGMVTALPPQDYLITAYRDHGYALARGTDPGVVMAELFGKVTGCARGRGGSMHLFDETRRFLGGWAIVGGHLPLAVGIGLAIDYRGGNEVVLCQFGEGATDIGAFHESLNIAKLWRLPIVFACTNNFYAMGMPVTKASAVPEIYKKACAYNMYAERVDGMDVLASREATERAIERARTQREPSLIEYVCYRYRGHSMSDPGKYRTKEEVQEMRERHDPIDRLKALMLERGLADEDRFKQVDKEIRDICNEAARFAQDSPEPDPAELWTDVLVEH